MQYPIINYQPTQKQKADLDGIVKKLVLGAVGTVVIYYSVRGVIRLVKGVPEKEEMKLQRDELEAMNQTPGEKQTISPSQAETYANGLHAAMDGYGTDWQYIKNTFYKIRNAADYLAISQAYGTREVSSGTWNPEANFNGNLAGALISELSESELQTINKILKDKKIKYRL